MSRINGPAEKIVSLLLQTRKVTETEQGSFGLRERMLFCLLHSPQPPRELMDTLCMVKSNLALLAKRCIEEGLIEKTKLAGDGRALQYVLTEQGRAYIESRLHEINGKFASVLTDEAQCDAANESLDAAVELLSFVP